LARHVGENALLINFPLAISMVIRTEYRSQRYSMGSLDPFPAGFEIRFGSLNFQAMGNDYLMRITNRDELHPWRSTGPGPVPVTPAADALALAQADAVGPSAPRRRRRSGQRSRQARMERHQAARVASQCDAPVRETASAPVGERAVPEQRFHHGMRNATMTYASSASTDEAAYEDLRGHHLLAVRNLIASTNDESYHGSASDLPPATSHGYAEWDFSGMQDPVMFQRFLDAADYWFGYSDDFSAGSYDPARECFVVVVDDQADDTNAAGAGDGEAPWNPRTGIPQNPGPSAPPTSPARGTDINAQLAQARELEAKLTEEYRAVRLLRATIAGEASARGKRARELGRQARDRINVDFDVNNPNTPPRASQKLIAAATLLRAMPAPSTHEAQNLHCEA
jgi:hypothetical protein